ncbi:MAG: efflux RND transporter permease subunit [Bacteroidota bacterium]
MSIYEKAVKKPITVVLIFIGVVILGLFSLRYLPIDLYPEIDPPMVSVFTFYEGASATDIETNVTRTLEDNLNTVNNLKELNSTSKDNTSLVTLEFEWGTNLDEATNEIRDALSRTETYLPDGAEKPIIFKFSTSMIPIMLLSATADESYPALTKILDEGVVNPLNRIEGVGSVSLSGGGEREVQVNVDPRELKAYNLSVEQIGAVIGQENINLPGGNVDVGNHTYPVRTEGEFSSSEEIKDLVVGHFQGKTVYLSDVAQVRDTLAEKTIDERSNGRTGARIVIQKQSGANSVEIAKQVRERLPELTKDLPPDVEIDTIFDTSEFIEDSIGSLSETVMYAGIFVVLVVLFFLGRWRATFIIVLTIPVSLIVSFIYLYGAGNTLNIISLSSLSIAIGMVVDDAIVVLENITRHIERGSSPREAAIYGTNEVGLAVVATTLTVVAVFFPLTLVQGLSGIMFRQLGMIVTLVVIVSTLAALTLTPMLSSKLLRKMPPRKKGLAKTIFGSFEKLLAALDNFYGKTLGWAIRHRAFIVISSIVIFGASVSLVSIVGTEFIPPSDNARIEATVELPMSLRLEETEEVARQIEDTWQEKYPEIEVISTSAGTADEENIFSAFGDNGSHIISFTLRLSKSTERERDIYLIGDKMREDLAAIPMVEDYSVSPGGSGGGMGSGASNVEVIVSGYNLDETGGIAEDISEKMEDMEGLRDIELSREDPKIEYQFVPDREKIGIHGLNTSRVASAIRNRVSGLVAAQYREEGEEYDVRVRFAKPFRESIQAIENIQVYNEAGDAIRVREVGHVEEVVAPLSIDRRNRQRVITVTGTLYQASITDVVNEINGEIDKMNLPAGVGTDIGGTAEDQQESFADLGLLLGLVIILVYIVMASQFESLQSPFIIMFTLPFAFTGVFVALFLTNTTLNLISMIGGVMLVGIVVKNGIVLIDYTNLMRDRGMSLIQAVITGGKSRLRPVLMTTFTTILGMLPLAIGFGEGAEIWRPMGVAIIGGLLVSTMVTLVLMPVVYTMFGANRLKSERKRIARLEETLPSNQ